MPISQSTLSYPTAAGAPLPTVPIEDDVKRNLHFAGSPFRQTELDTMASAAEPPLKSTSEDTLRALKAIFFWDNIAVSSAVCIGGSTLLALGEGLFRGRSGIPVISVMAHGLLLELCLNFFKGNLSSGWLEDSLWSNSRAVKEAAMRAQHTVLQAAALHDALLSASNPATTLKVVGFLWLMTYIAPALGIWRLMTCIYLGGFAWGAADTFCSESLGATYSHANTVLQEHVSSLGLRRPHKAVLLAASFAVLMYLSSWRTRLLTCFVCLVIVRCNLEPNEVKVLANTANETCAPYVRSARKQARRLSLAATDFVRRSSAGGKAHNR